MGRIDPAELPLAPRQPIVFLAEDLRSAHNVGSLLRTADALALEHVYLAGFTPNGNHRGVHKAALGSQDAVSWTHDPSTERLLDMLSEKGYTLAALEITDVPTDVAGLSAVHFPLALVLGNEVNGISDSTLARCHLALELPQYGMKHSLNVAVAAGVMGYDLVRRWHHLNPEFHDRV